MKIVADENIPNVEELFGVFGELICLPGRQITRNDVIDAEVLLVRSVTRVDASLLGGTAVKFVGTCTIGVDHLDTDYLKNNGIDSASAPGCNANAVVQYVIAVLAWFDDMQGDKDVVVVGGGNVGSRVYKALLALGFRCRCVDPFIDHGAGLELVEFSAVYSADIVCLHVPYTQTGPYPTHHMFGGKQLDQLKADVLLINAGRGGVIDNDALFSLKRSRDQMRIALDVWEHEPDIHRQLLDVVDIGTPHIAGYSLEGRVTGSLMIFDSLCRFMDVDQNLVSRVRNNVVRHTFGQPTVITALDLRQAVLSTYDVSRDFLALREKRDSLGSSFDQLRKHYPMRREFSHYRCSPESTERESFRRLGFVVDE